MKLNWNITLQILFVFFGLAAGVYFSNLSIGSHDESHLNAHSGMDHGFLDVGNDSIIPEIVNIEMIKDLMSGWNLYFETRNFCFTPRDASAKHIQWSGHAHLMINGVKVARVYSNWFHIPEMNVEIKEIEVTLNANSHSIMTANGKPISIMWRQL